MKKAHEKGVGSKINLKSNCAFRCEAFFPISSNQRLIDADWEGLKTKEIEFFL